MTFTGRAPPRDHAVLIIVLLTLQALALAAMGRSPICPCGTVKLWHGVVHSAESSQHVFDWYSLTHVMHGFWFYLLAWFLLRQSPFAARFSFAVFLEVAWEIVENTDFVIGRYRTGTMSFNYNGDSIVNSLADTLSMMLGFALARGLPVWATVAAGVAIETSLIVLIRDNLFLNVVMLIYPLDAIREWQAAAPVQ